MSQAREYRVNNTPSRLSGGRNLDLGCYYGITGETDPDAVLNIPAEGSVYPFRFCPSCQNCELEEPDINCTMPNFYTFNAGANR